jgi:hypothetical protein
MRRVASFIINNPGWFFLVALGLSVVFAIVAAVPQCSLRFGLSATLTLLMLMDSPSHVLQNPHLPMIIFGWLICVVGWLLLPVVIGIMIDAATRGQETEAERKRALRLVLYPYLTAQNIPDDKIDDAVNEFMKDLEEKRLRKS